jgi:hypothetical protein
MWKIRTCLSFAAIAHQQELVKRKTINELGYTSSSTASMLINICPAVDVAFVLVQNTIYNMALKTLKRKPQILSNSL